MQIKTLVDTVAKRSANDSTKLDADEMFQVLQNTVLDVNWVKKVERQHVLVELQKPKNGFYNWYFFAPTIDVLDGKAESDPDNRVMLSPHFALQEFITSQTASRLGINNQPPQVVINRLKHLCINVLEPLRQGIGPIIISSGYRCPALNKAVGGSRTSQHMVGEAADIKSPQHSDAYVQNYIRKHLNYDQLITEFPPHGWTHVSFTKNRTNKKQFFRIG